MQKKYLFLFSVLCSFYSCTDTFIDYNKEESQGCTIGISVDNYNWEYATRSSAEITPQGVQFAWADGDTISIYPDEGSQVEFSAHASEGSVSSAYFDGGAWSLKQGHSFRAFFPFDYANRTSDNIRIDYSGQSQSQNGVFQEACQKDFLYTEKSMAEGDILNFHFKHLGVFLCLNLTMPEATAFTSVTLCSADSIFPIRQRLELTGDTCQLTNVALSPEITLDLNNVTVDSTGGVLQVALFLPAIDLSEKKVYVAATDTAGNQYASDTTLPLPKLVQGRAYLRSANMIKEGEDGYVDPRHYQIKFIAIGNSFATDAMAYVPLILEELLPNSDINIGVAYRGSCSLKQHWDYISNNTYIYTYYYYYTSQNENKWAKKTYLRNWQCMMGYKDWDFVSFQQVSSSSTDYATYQPDLDYIIDNVAKNYPHTQPVWLLTHAYADGYKDCLMSDSMYYQIAAATRLVVDNTPIDYVIPYGTAIQNARHTELTRLGEYVSSDSIHSGCLSYEGMHLQAGLPRLISSYTVAQKILNLYGIHSSIANSNLHVSTDEDEILAIPNELGEVEQVSQEEYEIAKECALRAVNHPIQIYDTSVNY